MASVTLYRKRACIAGYWTGWGTVTGDSTVAGYYNSHGIYSATVNMSGASALTSLTFKNTFASDISAYVTFNFYLYTSDPTGGTGSIPSGYVASTSSTRSITPAGITSSVTFTGLNLTDVTTLYVWVTTGNYDASGGVIYCCDSSVASQKTTFEGQFSTAVMSLTVTPGSVTAGNAVTLTVSNGSGRSLTAVFKYGSTVLPVNGNTSVTFRNGSVNVTCPASWFDTAGVTVLQSMTVSVTVTGGTSTLTGSFDLIASSSMAPRISDAGTAIVQASGGAATYYPNTYIAGLSKCKVSAAVAKGSNAVISSVVLSYPGGSNVTMSYNSSTEKYEGTTAAPLTANTTFTITARDQRGMTATVSVRVTGVVAYTAPSVTVNVAFRCNSEGTELSGGEYWRIRATATISTELNNNSLKKLTAKIENGTEYALISGSTSSPLPGMTNPKSAYKVIVTVQDKVSGEVTKEITLEGLQRNIVWTRSQDGTYMGVGTTPSRTSGKSAVELPDGGSFLIGGEEYGAFGALVYGSEISQYFDGSNASFGNDFLNIDMEDRYALKNAAACFSSWGGACANGPNTLSRSVAAGLRLVYILTGMTAVVVLIEATPSPGRVWINVYHEAWKGWKYFYTMNDS